MKMSEAAKFLNRPGVSFFVPGIPAPGGSKKSFRCSQTGKIRTKEDCKQNPAWRSTVATVGASVMNGATPMDGPLCLEVTFHMPRVGDHYGTGRNAGVLKASAPEFHAVKPDATKLVRALEDALTGIVWKDDARIARQVIEKRYTDQTCGASVRVSPVDAVRIVVEPVKGGQQE